MIINIMHVDLTPAVNRIKNSNNMQHIAKLTTQELQELHYRRLVTDATNLGSLSQLLIAAVFLGIVVLLITIL